MFADYGWAVGLASAFLLYLLLTRLFPATGRAVTATAPVEGAPA